MFGFRPAVAIGLGKIANLFFSTDKSTKSSRSRSGGASQESETRSGRRSGQQNQDRSKKSGRQRLDESGSCSDDDSVKNVTRAKREKNPKKKNEEENREDLSNNNLIVGQEIDKGKPVESDDDSVSVSTSRRNISKKRKPKPVTTSIADNNEEQKNPSNKRKNLRQENVLAESSKDNIENEHKVKKRKKIPSSIKKQRRMIVESESSDSNDDSNTVVVNRRNAGKQQVPNKKKNTKVPIPIPQIDFTTSEESLESPDTEVINNIAADDNASVVVEQPTITINENVLEDSSGDKSDSSSEEEVEGILRLIIEENNEKYRKLRNSELTNNEVIVPDALTKSFASFVSPDHSSGTEEYPGIVVSITSVNESVAVGHMKISPKTVRPVDCLQNGSLVSNSKLAAGRSHSHSLNYVIK